MASKAEKKKRLELDDASEQDNLTLCLKSRMESRTLAHKQAGKTRELPGNLEAGSVQVGGHVLLPELNPRQMFYTPTWLQKKRETHQIQDEVENS